MLRPAGIGTTRVTCAVPLASMKLVSALGASAAVVGWGALAGGAAGCWAAAARADEASKQSREVPLKFRSDEAGIGVGSFGGGGGLGSACGRGSRLLGGGGQSG